MFGGDRAGSSAAHDAGGDDALGLDLVLGHLAELALHRRTATPLTIGFVGGPGSGKTHMLLRVSATIRQLAAAAAKQAGSPFLSKVHVQPVDAAALDGDIVSGIAACLYAGLRQSYPDLARDLAHRARDPHVVLRELNEKLDAARHRLDAERRALDDAGSRRARLTETVLYEAAGSQVDAYARANHTAIESRFTAFGIGGDPIRSYKEIVQYVAGSGGKLGLVSRALWAYKGQGKLIAAAILLVLAGVGLGVTIDTQDTWLESLRSAAKASIAAADWLDAHMGWLARARTVAFALAATAIACNVWRAFAFVTPIFKGARLLDSDLDTRRRDLDSLYAHQTKRVDTLDGDVERLTREIADAEKSVGGMDQASRLEPFPFAASAATQSQGFFAGLTKAMASGKGTSAPQRVVLALDHLDSLAPERARAILDTLHRAAVPGLVTVAAVDAGRLDPDGMRRSELTRWIEVPVRLDLGLDRQAASALVARALSPASKPAVAKADARASALDADLENSEAALLAELAPLAGASPRAVRRFVSLYSLARLDGGVCHGALAFMLAVAQGGTAGEMAAVATAIGVQRSTSAGAFELSAEAGPRLQAAFASARDLDGGFSVVDAMHAARTAARFTLG